MARPDEARLGKQWRAKFGGGGSCAGKARPQADADLPDNAADSTTSASEEWWRRRELNLNWRVFLNW